MIVEQKNKGVLITIKEMLGPFFWGLTSDLEPYHLVALNYHGTQLKFKSNFLSQLEFLAKSFDFVDPTDLFRKKCSSKPTKPGLLITFDDGLKNNLEIIEILNQFNIKALFFVVPKFIESASSEYFKMFIRPSINHEIDIDPTDLLPMSYQDISTLIAQGHTIGSHSLSHNLSTDMNEEEIKKEILDSKLILESKLGIAIDFFCSPNNTLFSVNKFASQYIENEYRLHFTTVNGRNIESELSESKKCFRTNVEAFWSLNQLKWAISAIENKRWKSKRLQLEGL